MNRTPALLAALICLTLGTLLGCGRGQAPEPDAGLSIVATTGPVGDLVRHVAGDLASVQTLMGPGVDPHQYKELPADLTRLSRADVVFYNGLHLEGQMGETFEQLSRRRPVFAVTQGLVESDDARLLKSADYVGQADPHVWHDVGLWRDCVQYVADRLAEVDPANADAYQQNAGRYIGELTELDQRCRAMLTEVPEDRRVMVTAHDAFAYFGKAYGMEVVGLKGISTEDEVDLRHMREVIDLIVERRVPCVFVESAVPKPLMEALAEGCAARGYQVTVPGDQHQLYADALGAEGGPAGDYVGMIRANVKTIVAGLTGNLGDAQQPKPE